MCKAAEDYGKEREIVKAVEIAKKLLKDNVLPFETALEYAGIDNNPHL